MKKITFLFIMLLILSGCSRTEEVETREDYYLSLAKDADSYEEVEAIIVEFATEGDANNFKQKLALLEGNDVIQEALLVSDELTPRLLMTILEQHKWSNIYYTKRRNLLLETIAETQLSPEQEMEIAKLGTEFGIETYQAGLLLKPDVSCKPLSYILTKGTSKLNLEYYKYKEWIKLQAMRDDWELEEKKELLNTGNLTVREALEKSTYNTK